MSGKRTKKERLEYVRSKETQMKAAGFPYAKYSFLTDEITALEWVLPRATEARQGET